jgi:hypothetical protein
VTVSSRTWQGSQRPVRILHGARRRAELARGLRERSELREAQKTCRFRERPVHEYETSTQVGFTQVALLRVLQTAQHPEREQWIAQYRAIDNGVDAALFMTDAKLKVQHGIELKVFNRATNPDKPLKERERVS